jgi:putative ABC transport system permease protein
MNPWRLAVRLACRELRGGLKGFRLFLACLALGVAAIAAVASMNRAVSDALRADARPLLGGDLDVRLTQRLPTQAEAAHLRATAAAYSAIIEMRAMARPDRDGAEIEQSGFDDGRSAMVELKAVDGNYPLIGQIELTPVVPLHHLLANRDGAWGAVADPVLLSRLGLQPGERIRIGDASFVLRGTVDREPDRSASVATFGPRLMIAEDALASTGLIQPGSLFRHATRIVLPKDETEDTWRAAALAVFADAGWQIRGTGDAAPGIQRFVDRLSLFLGFAGLTTLLIGGLGIAGAVRAYLEDRVQTIAILKCVGAPGGLVMGSYLLQLMLLAAFGTVFGLIVGATVPMIAVGAVRPLLPVAVQIGVYPGALAAAAALGLLTALTFSLWPLACARQVPAANLFRQTVAGLTGRPRAGYITATALSALALAALAVLITPDWLFGVLFVAGAALTLLLLRGTASFVRASAKRLPRARNAVVRLAVDGLYRPGAPTNPVLISLGTGLTVLVAVALTDANLRSQIGDRLPQSVPAFFFLDIRDDQRAAFDEAVAAVPGVGEFRRVPMLMGRIVRIDGMPVEQAMVSPETAWALRGDRTLTYASVPADGTRIEAGGWWPPDYAGPPLISFDATLAKGFGVGVGDRLTLNVLGRDIEARIASLRRIEWRSVPLDFATVFAPGTLEAAPHSDIAAVYARPDAEAALQRAVGERLPNVTAIRTRDAIEAATGLLAKIGWGVRAAALVTLAAGLLVLAGAIAGDRGHREREAVVFKMLGATRGRIARIYAVQYAVLGMVTALIAAGLGTAIAWAVTTRLMRFEWTMHGEIAALTVGVGTSLALAFGFIGTWRQLSRTTAEALRND